MKRVCSKNSKDAGEPSTVWRTAWTWHLRGSQRASANAMLLYIYPLCDAGSQMSASILGPERVTMLMAIREALLPDFTQI